RFPWPATQGGSAHRSPWRHPEFISEAHPEFCALVVTQKLLLWIGHGFDGFDDGDFICWFAWVGFPVELNQVWFMDGGLTSVGVSRVGKMPGALVVAQTAVQPTTSRVVQAYPSCSKPRGGASLRQPTGLPSRNVALWSSKSGSARRPLQVVCKGLGDFIGGDLLGFDLDKWVEDVEKYGSIAVYAPAEGGYEGRYCTRLKAEGYHFMNISARGLGDPEAYLTKVHGVRPPHLGKQAVVRYYYPPEVDYRLSLLPENCKGLVLWVLEAKVLSKSELQYLALLPAIRPNVKVIAECGTWRKYKWKPLKDVAGIPATKEASVEASS
ncbi:hypothetical protein KC19_4G118300, partial [Ceratodon purpureus]